MMNGSSLRSSDDNPGADQYSSHRTMHLRMLEIVNANDLHFMRVSEFRLPSFVDRFTTLNYALVFANTDRKPREI
jgi:hypothetical protein